MSSPRVLSYGLGLAAFVWVLACSDSSSPTDPNPSSNTSPTCTISSPSPGASYVAGDAVSFQGSCSDPQDGSLSGSALSWSSSLNGAIGTGISFSTPTLSVGSHTVTLTGRDSQGATGSATVSLTVVANQAPSAEISAPADGAQFPEGASVTFTGSATDPEEGTLSGTALSWSSSLDGALGTGTSLTTESLTAGSHTVTLTATDSRGATGTASVSITVTANQPPVADISAPADGAQFVEGASVTFTGSATDLEDGTLSGSALGWSSSLDGALGTGASFTTESLSVGSHTVTLTATDSRGATGTASVTVEIVTAPTAEFVQVGSYQGPDDNVASIAVSPDGTTLAFGTYADNLIRVVDVATLQVIHTLSGHTNRVTALAFSPDGQTLASTGTTGLQPHDGSVRLWDVSSGTQLASVSTPGTAQLVFSPDGSELAGPSRGDPVQIRVWNASTLTQVRSFSGVFIFVAFDADGDRIAAGARDDFVHIIDFQTGAQVATLPGHEGWTKAATYHPSGAFLASGGYEDRKIKLWDAQTGALTATLTGHRSQPEFLRYSPDGTILASLGSGISITRYGGGITMTFVDSDKKLRLWDLSTGAELEEVDMQGEVVDGVDFSSDWSVLVSGSQEGVIRVFRRGG